MWIALPLLLIASFPFKRIHRLQRKIIFVCLGLATYLPLMTILRDLAFLVSGTLIAREWVFLGTFVCVCAGTIHAWLGPHVKRVPLAIKELPSELEGLRIVQLSDLHIGPTIRKAYVKKVVHRTNSLSPDVVALTGDIGDGPVRVYRPDALELRELTATRGVFYVSGNHEHYWGVVDWMELMRECGIKVLVNSVEKLNHQGVTLAIAGIPDPVSRIKPDFDSLSQQITGSSFSILLSHRPGIAREAERRGFHLQLSGHTHGGQFFPWTIVVRFVHEFSRGLARLGQMWIYVNVGTGSWGPFLRLGTTTEITLLELVRAR